MHAAPGLRAWQMCRALLDGGHQVTLATFGERADRPASHAHLKRVCLAPGDFTDPGRLGEVLKQARPDAVITAGSYQPTRAACLLDTGLPIWIDLPGDMMAEAQLRAESSKDPDMIQDYRAILLPALERGDHFSVISRRQRYALIGQLGLAGRFGQYGAGRDELISVMPPAVEPAPRVTHRPRPDGIPADAFLVLSSGGYNTWCDVSTLFPGLARAMGKDPRIHFVSAGGPIPDHCEEQYSHFRSLVAGTKFSSRFHLLGWQWPEDLAALYAASDLAINMDRPCYEAELGSRNRLLDWARHGLPCITTATSELARDLCDRGLALEVPPNAPDTLAAAIAEQAANPEAIARMGAAARAEVEQRYSPAATTAPLLAWARYPTRHRDSGPPIPGPDASLVQAELRRCQAQLAALRGSVTYRGLQRASDLLGRLKGPKK